MVDQKRLTDIRNWAVDLDWGVRENAAGAIKEINDRQFAEYLPVWQEWVCDPNPNIRRAVEVGLLRIPAHHYADAFDLLALLLVDADPYVRKNCGPFALSAVAMRNPVDALARFARLIESEDANLRWNIAMCLGVFFGTRFPRQSINLLHQLSFDRRRFVWRAAVSSLVKLLRRYPQYREEVLAWQDLPDVLAVLKKYVQSEETEGVE